MHDHNHFTTVKDIYPPRINLRKTDPHANRWFFWITMSQRIVAVYFTQSLLWLVCYANSSHLSKCYYQLLLFDLASVSGQAPPICTHNIYTCNLSRTLGFLMQISSWCNCSVDDQRINHKIYLYIFWRFLIYKVSFTCSKEEFQIIWIQNSNIL